MSEDTKEELAVDDIGNEAHDNTHHRPASIIHLLLLPGGEETLLIVVFNDHGWFNRPHILLSLLVCSDGHFYFCKDLQHNYIGKIKPCQGVLTGYQNIMSLKGLEPSRDIPLEPKPSASTNSATTTSGDGQSPRAGSPPILVQMQNRKSTTRKGFGTTTYFLTGNKKPGGSNPIRTTCF